MTVTYDYRKRTTYTDGVDEQKRAHKTLAEVAFTPSLPQRGYTNRTLVVDLGTRGVSEKTVTEEMKEVFVGGRGFGLWYLWNAIKPTTKWNDPEN
ncbi:MAG: aldehyde ferredoxin oxidoreductase N-terminal domain-containing protein, partial [Bacteroidales bacterium]